jgi:maltooligosyltrehalose synthase
MTTYRLQLHAGFPFAAARRVLPYVRDLGATTLYLSPILAARRGSMHGYDVVDPARVSTELGGLGGFRSLVASARRHGLSVLVDIVPNHMAATEENRWWADVCRRGAKSRWASFFDVDWERGGGKVVLPVLTGDPDDVVERPGSRLVHWRRAPHDVDYRRFFDIN